MKGNRKQYPKVNQLPEGSMSVSNYAKMRGFSVAYIYKLFNKGEIKIVDFQGYNFVLINS